MFTGIIESLGKVAALEQKGGDVRLYIRAPNWSWKDVTLGDSIATNGVCLTAVDLPGDGFWADVSVETLTHTSIKHWKTGTAVNLEKALMPTSRLGGHIVSGHVDGVGKVLERKPDGRSERFTFEMPSALSRYVAHKGSITIDGTSLTVNTVSGCTFSVNIVPHTMEKTVIGGYKADTEVNLEVDVIARYLERLLKGESLQSESGESSNLSQAFLAEHGFLK